MFLNVRGCFRSCVLVSSRINISFIKMSTPLFVIIFQRHRSLEATLQRCDVSSQSLHQLCKFYDQLSFPFLFFSLLRMKDYHHSVYLLFSRWIHDIYLFREPSISISPLSFWFHRSFKYSLIYLLIYEAILFAPFQPLNLKIRSTSYKWKLNSIDTILITRIIQNYNKYI